MATKHWTTARVISSRYPGRYLDIYVNEAGNVFQEDTPFAYNEPVIADIINSPDCPYSIVNYQNTQFESPYIDCNMAIRVNGVEIYRAVVNESGTVLVPPGSELEIEAFVETGSGSGGVNPKLELNVKRNGVDVYPPTVTAGTEGSSQVYTEPSSLVTTYDAKSQTYDDAGSVPTCPDRVLVFQICNSNSARDDNFDVYLNDTLIGSVNLNSDAEIGSVFIASLDTTLEITSADFICPVENMVAYYFNPVLLQATNSIKMINTQNNNNGNFGSVGIRNYLKTGSNLSAPCVIADLSYSGPSGVNFELGFGYTACCPEDE